MNRVDFSQEELCENRVWGGLGYWLFFVPLIKNRHSELCRFCANQGLLLLIVETIVSAAFSIFKGVPLIGWIFSLAGGLVNLAILLIALFFMIQLIAYDRAYELPFIGHIRLIR